jgi:alkanesulfonate monooxygenase SsuD/methylene tetrahydromethanopterin reductase-like flavin-dependent oxidoreductase (luciferase family)
LISTNTGRIAFRLRDDHLPFPVLQELARLTEERGCDTIFCPEGGGRDVFLTLAAYANATKRARLSPGIASIYTRTPGVLAASGATLDQLSDGRAIIGLGTGHAQGLLSGHGMTLDRPLARMRDYVLLIRAVLRGDTEMPRTKTLEISRLRLGTDTRADLPIYIAALGPKMCRLAGEVADGVILNWATPAYASEAVAQVREGAERAGRDPLSVDIAMYLRVAPTVDEATRKALAADIASYAQLPFYRAMMDDEGFTEATKAIVAAGRDNPEQAGRAVPEAMIDALTVSGRQAVQASVAEYHGLGVTLPVLAPLTTRADTFETWKAAVDLL